MILNIYGEMYKYQMVVLEIWSKQTQETSEMEVIFNI